MPFGCGGPCVTCVTPLTHGRRRVGERLLPAVVESDELCAAKREELNALSQALSDPSFRKFQAAMSRPAAQQQQYAGTAKAGMQLGALVNIVLVNHHLNEVH
jgi:hypothetical protein